MNQTLGDVEEVSFFSFPFFFFLILSARHVRHVFWCNNMHIHHLADGPARADSRSTLDPLYQEVCERARLAAEAKHALALAVRVRERAVCAEPRGRAGRVDFLQFPVLASAARGRREGRGIYYYDIWGGGFKGCRWKRG